MPCELIVPTVEFPPGTPFTLQLYLPEFCVRASCTTNCVLCIVPMVVLAGVIVRLPELSETLAWADFVGSAALVAVTVMPAAGCAGAVYKPEVEIVPTLELPPTAPFTLQVTLVFGEPLTDALNCWVWDGASVLLVGEMVTETLLTTVIEAEADFVGSATLVAVIVALAGEGRALGAV